MSIHQEQNQRTANVDLSEPMLTMREACRLLNVHSNTLRRWGHQGMVRMYRVGPRGHRRFRREDVVDLLTEQMRI
ncbi:MAG: DNA-binding protein [Chloroflexi bacterium]|nr:MAG: DNA-binding protein [Chloroflexota bacterium]